MMTERNPFEQAIFDLMRGLGHVKAPRVDVVPTPEQIESIGELIKNVARLGDEFMQAVHAELRSNAPMPVPFEAYRVADRDNKRLRALNAELSARVGRLTRLLDDQLGTPCEQIRHANEKAELVEALEPFAAVKYRDELAIGDFARARVAIAKAKGALPPAMGGA